MPWTLTRLAGTEELIVIFQTLCFNRSANLDLDKSLSSLGSRRWPFLIAQLRYRRPVFSNSSWSNVPSTSGKYRE